MLLKLIRKIGAYFYPTSDCVVICEVTPKFDNTYIGWGISVTMINRGHVALVGYDPQKSLSDRPFDAYRTGKIVYLSRLRYDQLFGEQPPAQGVVLVEQRILESLDQLPM